MNIIDEMKTNIFDLVEDDSRFIGSAFTLTYDKLDVLTNDADKQKVDGIPQSSFLLAFYANDMSKDKREALLLRVISPVSIPTDDEMISTLIEYYKDGISVTDAERRMDDFTRYDLSFSGLECRILGTFYENNGKLLFGSDVENFYAPNNYKIYKPTDDVLDRIINFSESEQNTVKIGKARFSSTMRYQSRNQNVDVRIDPLDLVGKRTALFGMTRTGKSNTVKKIIEETVLINKKIKDNNEHVTSKLGLKKVGQIIFDMNGEYANDNQQDNTSIYQKFSDEVVRYSLDYKPGFREMKINFFHNILGGFEYIKSNFDDTTTSDYFGAFLEITLVNDDVIKDLRQDNNHGRATTLERIKAAYECVLDKAGFEHDAELTVKFKGKAEINSVTNINPEKGVKLSDAYTWFKAAWEDEKYANNLDGDLQSVLTVLLKKKPGKGSSTSYSGYKKIEPLRKFHTKTTETSFEDDIVDLLREGKIIILDLSQGDPEVQSKNAKRICTKIFENSMKLFTRNEAERHNFIQFYFEEAHNLFPKQNEKDLTNIYNRLAKEGAKLRLGIVYATQEVSSISNNILKNTQNWFISHLNNSDETRELKKYYDFGDFTDALIRYSNNLDKGFARIKTLSNSFVIPTQIDKFTK